MKALQKVSKFLSDYTSIGGNRYCSSHIFCTGNDGMGKSIHCLLIRYPTSSHVSQSSSESSCSAWD